MTPILKPLALATVPVARSSAMVASPSHPMALRVSVFPIQIVVTQKAYETVNDFVIVRDSDETWTPAGVVMSPLMFIVRRNLPDCRTPSPGPSTTV